MIGTHVTSGSALLGQLKSNVMQNLRWDRRRLEMVAHAGLVHALHHTAALPGRRWKASFLDGLQAWVPRVRVAPTSLIMPRMNITMRSAGFRHYGHDHHQGNAHRQRCFDSAMAQVLCFWPLVQSWLRN